MHEYFSYIAYNVRNLQNSEFVLEVPFCCPNRNLVNKNAFRFVQDGINLTNLSIPYSVPEFV
jgi:hypothetical protein